MTRWRYRTIVTQSFIGQTLCYVTSIDGDTDAPILSRRMLHVERILLTDYLASAGEEGWEVCGMSPIEGGGSSGASVPVLIVLKRPTAGD